jgi:diaminopimelate epimerase
MHVQHQLVSMTHEFRFLKYQACGNDFILKDERQGAPTPDLERGRLARTLCRRRFQVGADGLLFVERAEGVDGSMRLFEPDGKEADMCGNGLRCVAAYLTEDLQKDEVAILTRDGVKRVARRGELFTADMGAVRTGPSCLKGYLSVQVAGGPDGPVRIDLGMPEGHMEGYMVNTGEPHVVVFTDDLDGEDVVRCGAAISKDYAKFPKATNVDFVQVAGPGEIRVRTYERGVFDETLACGTGATASAAVSLMLGRVKQGPVTVTTRGGQIMIDLGDDDCARMTGPAVKVFEGSIVVAV